MVWQVLKSVGMALAWYLGSSAAALAVASASGLPLEARPRKSLRIGPTLLILYIFSAKNVKKRGRCVRCEGRLYSSATISRNIMIVSILKIYV